MEQIFDEQSDNSECMFYGNAYFRNLMEIQESTEEFRPELNLLNSLLMSGDLQKDFIDLIQRYPEVRRCIPLLFAAEGFGLVTDNGETSAVFSSDTFCSTEDYVRLMEESGIFNLIRRRKIFSFYDYALGVQVGIDTVGRGRREREHMRALVGKHLIASGMKYHKKVGTEDLKKRWHTDVTSVSENDRIFDFVVVKDGHVYAIDVDFYAEGVPELPDIAESRKTTAAKSKNISGFSYVWVVDGKGWLSAKDSLREAFYSMEHIYSLNDLENGAFKEIFGNRT